MGRLSMPLAAHRYFLHPPTSGGSMAAPAILAKGSHEGMLILDGTNRETAATVVVARADAFAIEEQVAGVAGNVRRR